MPPLGPGRCLKIHRLHQGSRHIQVATLPVPAEGGIEGPPPHFIPECPALDAAISALHTLARSGHIPYEVAERQLNTYLLAASTPAPPHIRPRLVLPVSDAPHYHLLPDLGHVMHRIICKDPAPCTLSAVLDHWIPGGSTHAPPARFEDSQPCLLNLVLALVLGLYPGTNVKRPGFRIRARLFADVHRALTSCSQEQSAFCQANAAVVHLAAAEYVARVIPAYIPAQSTFLHERDPSVAVYFRRVPTLCDELRQTLDDTEPPSWPAVAKACASVNERIARLKKANSVLQPRNELSIPKTLPSCIDIGPYWAVPRLRGPLHECRLLARGLRLDEAILQHLHSTIRVHSLPDNLRKLQEEAIRSSRATSHEKYIRTRHFMCMKCSLLHRAERQLKLRLDTLHQELVCSSCSQPSLVCVNMVGKILSHHTSSLFLCPRCITVQTYTELDTTVWSASDCHHTQSRARPQPGGRDRPVCAVCSETTSCAPVERVNHQTGLWAKFSFCSRHLPRHELLADAFNARQLAHVAGVDYTCI